MADERMVKNGPRALALLACVVAINGAAPAAAQAVDPAAGQALYTTPLQFAGGPLACVECHGPGEVFGARLARLGLDLGTLRQTIDAAIAANRGGEMAKFAVLTPAQRTDIAAYLLASAPPEAVGTAPTLAPNPLRFAATATGSASAVAGVLVTNTGSQALLFADPPVLAVDGHVDDFEAAAAPAGTSACGGAGATLAPGVSCSLGIRFVPRAAGERSASWRVDFAGGLSQTLALQGSGIAAAAPPPPAAPAPAAPTPSARDDEGGGAADALALAALLTLLACRARRRRR